MDNQETFKPIKTIFGKYRAGSSFLKMNLVLQSALNDIDDRLTAIEEKISKTARKTVTTKSQQILLLHHLGFLDILKNDLKMSNKKQAKLLSVLLNASEDNIEGDLAVVRTKQNKLKSSHNYKVVASTFKDAGLKQLEKDTDIILDELIKLEDK